MKLNLNKIIRKIYKLFHPPLGEVLMLHRIVKNRSTDSTLGQLEISPDFLEKTILNYTQMGYRLISIDEVVTQLMSKKHPKLPFVCFTFDDGFADNYELAYPILKKYNCPFCIYVTSGFVNRTHKAHWYISDSEQNDKLILSINQLKQLSQDPLCTIGAHSVSHPRFTQINEIQKSDEIINSKKFLEDLLNKPIIHFAYPHGDYDSETISLLKKAGITSAVIVNGGKVRKGDKDLFRIKRILLEELL